MHQVEVIRNGVEIGKVRFRGINDESCGVRITPLSMRPKNCVPKNMFGNCRPTGVGLAAGHEGDYEWHTSRVRSQRPSVTDDASVRDFFEELGPKSLACIGPAARQ